MIEPEVEFLMNSKPAGVHYYHKIMGPWETGLCFKNGFKFTFRQRIDALKKSMRNRYFKLKYSYYAWKLKEIDDETCCCGDPMKNHYSDNHQAKSERSWAIEMSMK
jgi:hypothetical protein